MSIARMVIGIICMTLGACSGPGTLTGTIAGNSFEARGAISGISSDGKTLFILVTNFPSACEAAAACGLSQGNQVFEFALENGAGPVGVGTYSVTGGSMSSSISYLGCVMTGRPSGILVATIGSVMLSAANDGGFDGSVDASMSDGSKISGSFTTSPCAALSTSAFHSCAFTCPP